MRLQFISDLHLEGMRPDVKKQTLDSIPVAADLLVIAGDLTVWAMENKVGLREFFERWKDVIYVKGNHEYYRSSFPETDGRVQAFINSCPNIHLLDGSRPVRVQNRLFWGDTLWFPDLKSLATQNMLADFSQIEDPHKIPSRCRRFLSALKFAPIEGAVVVTHHMPSVKSIDPKFINSPINCYFVCEQAEPIILKYKPALWIHGHTHASCDYMLEGTRVVCNALGYNVGENPRWDPAKTVEIE